MTTYLINQKNMMKKIKLFFSSLLILLLTFVSTNCSSENNKQPIERVQGVSQAMTVTPVDIIVDDGDATGVVIESGNFYDATGASEHWASMSSWASVGGVIDRIKFTPELPTSEGDYEILVWNSCFYGRSRNVPHVIFDGKTQPSTTTVLVDQDCATGNHGTWFSLGTYSLSNGASVTISDEGITPESNHPYIGADAVRFIGSIIEESSSSSSISSSSSSTNQSSASSGGSSSGAGGNGGTGGTNGEGASSSSSSSVSSGSGSGGAGGNTNTPVNEFGIDYFNGNTLDLQWSIINQDMFNLSVNNGRLTMTPHSHCSSYPYCGWFNETSGPAIVKDITGDFIAQTLVRPRNLVNQRESVSGGYQFGGIIARDPNSSAENHIFTVVGFRQEIGVNALANERKNTTNNVSSVVGPALENQSTGDRELRLCRSGANFNLFIREIGQQNWDFVQTYNRALPTTLEVGPIAYTYGNTVSLVAEFDYFEIKNLEQQDCLN